MKIKQKPDEGLMSFLFRCMQLMYISFYNFPNKKFIFHTTYQKNVVTDLILKAVEAFKKNISNGYVDIKYTNWDINKMIVFVDLMNNNFLNMVLDNLVCQDKPYNETKILYANYEFNEINRGKESLSSYIYRCMMLCSKYPGAKFNFVCFLTRQEFINNLFHITYNNKNIDFQKLYSKGYLGEVLKHMVCRDGHFCPE